MTSGRHADAGARARRALAAWGLGGAALAPIEVGLINLTYRVEDGARRSVLQRLNPVFSPRVHEDIAAVTAHLAARGMETPRLEPTLDGALWTETEGEVWRLLSFVEGDTHERLASPAQAEGAGALLGRFHREVADLWYEFVNRRLGVHDTPKHLAHLARALDERADHPRYLAIAPLGEALLAAAESLPALPGAADRVVHGDPKISNLLFFPGRPEARCLIDLDTLARMPVALELGDAFRSWCNPGGEDVAEPRFDLDLFEAALRGYAAGAAGLLEDHEVEAIVPATGTIMVELAARFCADALEERYFGWDPGRFATRGEHCELRARGQLALAASLAAVGQEARGIARRALGR